MISRRGTDSYNNHWTVEKLNGTTYLTVHGEWLEFATNEEFDSFVSALRAHWVEARYQT